MEDYKMESNLYQIIKDCKNINEDYDFYSVLIKHGHYFTRNKFLDLFSILWEYIPEEHLYPVYQDLLSDIHIIKGREWYTEFFKPEIISKIMKHNKHDTVENPELISLLDNNGFLTVYHAHCNRTLRDAHTWTLNKEQAVMLGGMKAILYKNPDFYVVTGKVKLDDVIAFIQVREDRDEVAVLNKNVSDKTKEIFKVSDIDSKNCFFSWWV